MINKIRKIGHQITSNQAVSRFHIDDNSEKNFNAERENAISDLVSGKMKKAMKSCRIFIHNYWDKYDPIPIGDYKLQGVNDVSRHVAAMDDVLSKWLEGKADVFNKRIDFLKEYIKEYGDYRIPHVLLAWEYLKKSDYITNHDKLIFICIFITGSFTLF